MDTVRHCLNNLVLYVFMIIMCIMIVWKRGIVMAKIERRFKGDFNHFVSYLEEHVVRGSMSASIEDSSRITFEDVRVAVLVFERYSVLGKNRVSLNVTIVSKGEEIVVSAITSGGSQAIVFKVNTLGESGFLSNFETIIDDYIR